MVRKRFNFTVVVLQEIFFKYKFRIISTRLEENVKWVLTLPQLIYFMKVTDHYEPWLTILT